MDAISRDDVLFLLEPHIGLPLLMRHASLCNDLAQCLHGFFYKRITLDTLCQQVERMLFNGIYTATNGTMVTMDMQGRPRKIHSDALPALAELLMEPVFARFPVDQASFDALNEYSLHHTSLPALKRLYLDFGDCMPAMNRALCRRIIVENFPPEAWQDWLEPTP